MLFYVIQTFSYVYDCIYVYVINLGIQAIDKNYVLVIFNETGATERSGPSTIIWQMILCLGFNSNWSVLNTNNRNNSNIKQKE